MFNNPYANSYNPQMTVDRINAQMNELEKMKQQLQQPVQQPVPNVTQNFQITPSNQSVIKYANSMEEVQRNMVIGDTPFFSNDMSIVWIKDTKGNIKSYELTEIIPQDDKDLLITSLQMQIEELRKEIKNNAKSNDDDVNETTSNEKSSNVSNARTSKKK